MATKTKKSNGSTIATDKGVVIAEYRHVEATPAVELYDVMVAISTVDALREKFTKAEPTHTRIAEALVAHKTKCRGASTVAILPITQDDAWMIVNYLLERPERNYRVAGSGLRKRIEKGMPRVGEKPAKAAASKAASTGAVTSGDFREGYNDAMTAFSENLNDPTTLDSLKDAEKFYRDLVEQGAATDYARGMATGLAQRLA